MEQNKRMLEKALRRLKKTNPRNIMVKKNYPEPEEYSIRVDGFKIVLIHKEITHISSLDSEISNTKLYGLRFVYLRNNHIAMSFNEENESLGKIKEVYNLVEKKLSQYDKIRAEKEENTFKRKFKRLERLL
jgi:hypothetical protein